MKLNAGKRILMFFHWLFSLLICAIFALHVIKPEWTSNLFYRITGNLAQAQVTIIGIALLAVYVILAVAQAFIVFSREGHGDRGFITVDSSDSGRVRIAVTAIEQMVRQSVINIDGITDMRIGIENRDDAIAININATLQNGCHVPTITMNMQRAIRQFVEMNCGVAVRSVSISINAVANPGEGGRRRGRRRDDFKPAPVFAPEAPQGNTTVSAPDTPIFPENAVEGEPQQTFDEPETPAEEYPVNDPEAIIHESFPEEITQPESDSIPDPEPIRLHFDHLPQQEQDAQAPGENET